MIEQISQLIYIYIDPVVHTFIFWFDNADNHNRLREWATIDTSVGRAGRVL